MGAVEPAEQTVFGIARAYQLSQALYVAAKLGVADVLEPQPLTAEAIARAVGARASQLRVSFARSWQPASSASSRTAGSRPTTRLQLSRRRARPHARRRPQLRRGDVSLVR